MRQASAAAISPRLPRQRLDRRVASSSSQGLAIAENCAAASTSPSPRFPAAPMFIGAMARASEAEPPVELQHHGPQARIQVETRKRRETRCCVLSDPAGSPRGAAPAHRHWPAACPASTPTVFAVNAASRGSADMNPGGDRRWSGYRPVEIRGALLVPAQLRFDVGRAAHAECGTCASTVCESMPQSSVPIADTTGRAPSCPAPACCPGRRCVRVCVSGRLSNW